MIEVRGLSKSFKVHTKEAGLLGSVKAVFYRKWVEKTALRSVDLDVGAGEILGLVGANGAGKTTLVKILAGIIHPTSGVAKVLGHTPWERRNEFRRQIALIMGQKAQLWWDLPAADCFLLLREIYNIPESEYKKTLGYLAESLGVQDQMGIQIRRLSLGERMKMELMAALLHKPKIVFLDEPTIGLDLTAQKAIRKFLLEYRQEHQPAMILTSHYMEDIETLCKRIVIIREGAFVYDGPLKNIADKHAAHKVITLRFSEAQTVEKLKGIVNGSGRIVQTDAYSLQLLIERDRALEASAHLLKSLPVSDLTVENEDIGNVIESIMKKRPNV